MSKLSAKTFDPDFPPFAPTGVEGLDVILHGGLPREEMHLVQGTAGTGKTTIALTFLREGAKSGEACLYITLSQSKRHLERIARSHGWNLDGVTIHELTPGTVAERIAGRQTVLATPDVELHEVFQDLVEAVQRVNPRRAVVDSVTVIRMLAGSPQRYHGEIVTLRQLFVERDCTVMFLADHPAEMEQGAPPEVELHPLSGCVIHLEQEPRLYGDARRRLRVVKARGMPCNGGYHDVKIHKGEICVYPRLGAYRIPECVDNQRIPSGIVELDRILGGGLDGGTTGLIVGPSGTGKSTMATSFAVTAANSGQHVAIFLFDERPETYISRSEGVGLPMRSHIEAGRMMLRQVDPGEIAPGEFAQQVRELVDVRNTGVVIIDSVIGYFNAMGSSNVLAAQLHELITYCSRRGILTLLCGAQEGFMSLGTQEGVDVSYLSDSIVVLGFFEAEGTIRRCMAAVKKKQGAHDSSIRELFITNQGVKVGERPLSRYRNLLLRDSLPSEGPPARE